VSVKITIRRRDRIAGVVGLLLIGIIGLVADVSANESVRTAPRRAVRAVAKAVFACLTWRQHEGITRPRSA